MPDLPYDLDPVLETFAPGIGVVFGCLMAAVIAAVLADGLIQAGTWIAGIPERRKQRHVDVMRQIIREWNEPDIEGVPPKS